MAVTLDLDGSVSKINANLKSTRDNLVGVAEGYEKINDASKKAANGAVKGQEQMSAAVKKGGQALDQQRGIIEKLEGHLKRLETGQKKATKVSDIKKYNTEIAKTRATLQQLGSAGVKGISNVNVAARASNGIFNTLKGTIATTFAPLALAGAALAGVREIISTVSEYEQTAADLQAITGANGDTLDFLKQSAIEVGIETTASAGQTLEAYKLIASAKPELLDNAEGLATITREAVTLTEAMGGDLPTAATNLTDIMNQFNAPAEEAGRFVNALAAGSKEGSAEVGQLAASLLVAGVEVKSSNVSFEESVGLLEAMAENGRKGAEAGTGLRNILSKLSATDILPKDAVARLRAAGVDIGTLSDKSLSFTDRLRALAPVQNDANALTAVFGLENKAAAAILLENVDRVDELTAAVTGTNTAQEQAATRTKTAAGEYARLKNTLQALIAEGGDGLGGLLAVILSFVRNGLLFMRDRIKDLSTTFGPLVDAVRDFGGVIISLLPAQEKASGGASLWGKAVKIANVPIKALFILLTNGIKITTSITKAIADFVKGSPRLNSFFNTARTSVVNFLNGFVQIPEYLAGSLAAVREFVTSTARAIGQLGSNIGQVLKESFSFKKLLTEGTGDLKNAVSELLVNPFEGITDNVKKVFNDTVNEFRKTEPIEVKVETTPTVNDAPRTPETPTPSTPFVDPEQLRKDEEKKAKEAEKLAQDIARTRLAAMKDGVEKQLALEEVRFTDLLAKLEAYGIDSTEAVQQNELNKFQIRQKFLSDAADLEGLTGEERVKFLYDSTKQQIDAIESALKEANGGELLADQVAQINLLRKQAGDEYLAQLEELQDKETKAALAHEIALLETRTGEFDTLKDFETFKQEEILKIRLKFAEKQLALLKSVEDADQKAILALQGTINSIKGDLENFNVEGDGGGFSIFKLVGLDPDDPEGGKIIEGIQTAVNTTIGLLKELNDARLESAQKAIDQSDREIEAIDKKIDAEQTALDAQQALDDKGFSNNEENITRRINLLKKQRVEEEKERQKALNEKKKIQRQQAVIDTLTQSTSLLSASAQVFNSVAAIPFVGPAIGAGLVAAMIGSFIAAKARVFQNISQTKAKKGLYRVADGRSHDAGGVRLGDQVEIESKEGVAVFSREATARDGALHEAFTKAANSNDRFTMSKIAEKLSGQNSRKRKIAKGLDAKEAKVVSFSLERENSELKKSNKLLEGILSQSKQPKKEVKFLNGKKIVTKGKTRYIIKTA